MPTKSLLKQTQSSARKRFGRLPLAIWHAWLGGKSYRAYVINTKNGVVLYRGPLSSSTKEAVKSMRKDLEEALKKTS